VVLRHAGSKCIADARGQAGVGQPAREGMAGAGRFFRRVDQLGHHAVHGAHAALGVDDQQSCRHAVDHLLKIVAVLAKQRMGVPQRVGFAGLRSVLDGCGVQAGGHIGVWCGSLVRLDHHGKRLWLSNMIECYFLLDTIVA
jgi:hypothetical protein